MSIGVAIIGGGIFAREEHLPAVEASEHLTLKAVYSRSLKSAQSLATDATKVDLYSDDSGEGKAYKDLLARSDIHGVIIVLPILKQPEFIKEALSAGKHVLSEKPIAENTKDAQELIQWYHSNIDKSKVTWGVAENFRFLNSFQFAAEKAESLGKVLNFRVQFWHLIKGGKYFETEWRKTPSHQGGFILDGGVHFMAGIRQLLGSDCVAHVSAFSTQSQPHLPPLDTVDAALKLNSGATGTISLSFGTTLKAGEYAVAYEKGSVTVSSDVVSRIASGKPLPKGMLVTTIIDDNVEEKEAEDEGAGVKPEIRAWGEGIVTGKLNARQKPEQALADLELIEKMLKSAEANGTTQTCQFQI